MTVTNKKDVFTSKKCKICECYINIKEMAVQRVYPNLWVQLFPKKYKEKIDHEKQYKSHKSVSCNKNNAATIKCGN